MTAFLKSDLFKKIRQKSGLDNLDRRERKVMLGGLLFVVCFLIFQFAIFPFLDSRKNLMKSIERKRGELVEIKQLQAEYHLLKIQEGGIKKRIAQRSSNFALFTFLDKQAGKAKVKKQIKFMKPTVQEGVESMSESIVEMKIQKVPLSDLIDFIRFVESEKNVVTIKRISIQENGNENGFLDASIRIVTYEIKE